MRNKPKACRNYAWRCEMAAKAKRKRDLRHGRITSKRRTQVFSAPSKTS